MSTFIVNEFNGFVVEDYRAVGCVNNPVVQRELDRVEQMPEDTDWEAFWGRYKKIYEGQAKKAEDLAFNVWRGKAISETLERHPEFKHNGKHFYKPIHK